jgi:hypothetical protein
MNEQDLAKRIAGHLDQGLAGMDQGTASRLQAARFRAMEHFGQQQSTAGMVLAGHGHSSRSHHHGRPGYRVWLPLLVLILGLFAINLYWQSRLTSDVSEIDAGLLGGELPIRAYLDKDFGKWLDSSSN